MLFAGLAVRERKRSQVKVDGLMDLMRIAEDKLAELQQQMLVEFLLHLTFVMSYDHIWKIVL